MNTTKQGDPLTPVCALINLAASLALLTGNGSCKVVLRWPQFDALVRNEPWITGGRPPTAMHYTLNAPGGSTVEVHCDTRDWMIETGTVPLRVVGVDYGEPK